MVVELEMELFVVDLGVVVEGLVVVTLQSTLHQPTKNVRNLVSYSRLLFELVLLSYFSLYTIDT